MRIHFFAVAALGKGLSGSDRIFIEFAKRLSKKNLVTLYVWKEGYDMCIRQGLKESKNVKFRIINVDLWCKFGFLICYLARIIEACFNAFLIKLENDSSTVIYSASEFWMDSLPGFILKVRFPKIKWIAAWFQTAPNPLKGFTEGSRENTYKLSAFFYWFMQLPIKPLVNKFADFVLVNNENERKQFSNLEKQNKVLVILGAVNIEEIENWSRRNKSGEKIFEGVFQGRFHPQKGVVELIDIWKLVVHKMPDAKLAMIGDGPLMNDVRLKIKDLRLGRNIKLFGYIFDGDEKYRIFSQSKIVVHPAYYDSGGMAAAEAMTFGLPCVGFNLNSYNSYYPKGMIKVKAGDLRGFSDKIIKLVRNRDLRQKIGNEAIKMIKESWSWDLRVRDFLERIQ